MGRKSNPEWREANEERKARQRVCVWCGRHSAPRYLVADEDGELVHRACLTQRRKRADNMQRIFAEHDQRTRALVAEVEAGVTYERLLQIRRELSGE